MLVLTRKQNEKIVIGDEITITIVRAKGKSVRLGIEAPPHIRVLRGEVKLGAASLADAADDNVSCSAPTRQRPLPDVPQQRRTQRTSPKTKPERCGPFDASRLRRPNEEANGANPIAKVAPLQTLVSKQAI